MSRVSRDKDGSYVVNEPPLDERDEAVRRLVYDPSTSGYSRVFASIETHEQFPGMRDNIQLGDVVHLGDSGPPAYAELFMCVGMFPARWMAMAAGYRGPEPCDCGNIACPGGKDCWKPDPWGFRSGDRGR